MVNSWLILYQLFKNDEKSWFVQRISCTSKGLIYISIIFTQLVINNYVEYSLYANIEILLMLGSNKDHKELSLFFFVNRV